MFQSSFELTGYITFGKTMGLLGRSLVSKLFRAYRLYNKIVTLFYNRNIDVSKLFRAYRLYNDIAQQSGDAVTGVSKLFRAYRLYNLSNELLKKLFNLVSKLFRAYRLYNELRAVDNVMVCVGFKALSSLQVI